jgi:hypothetical protein
MGFLPKKFSVGFLLQWAKKRNYVHATKPLDFQKRFVYLVSRVDKGKKVSPNRQALPATLP